MQLVDASVRILFCMMVHMTGHLGPCGLLQPAGNSADDSLMIVRSLKLCGLQDSLSRLEKAGRAGLVVVVIRTPLQGRVSGDDRTEEGKEEEEVVGEMVPYCFGCRFICFWSWFWFRESHRTEKGVCEEPLGEHTFSALTIGRCPLPVGRRWRSSV